MVTREDLRCTDCGSSNTRLSLQVDRGGGMVRFRVECAQHGGFSHYLEHGPVQRAVKVYLDGLKAADGVKAR